MLSLKKVSRRQQKHEKLFSMQKVNCESNIKPYLAFILKRVAEFENVVCCSFYVVLLGLNMWL